MSPEEPPHRFAAAPWRAAAGALLIGWYGWALATQGPAGKLATLTAAAGLAAGALLIATWRRAAPNHRRFFWLLVHASGVGMVLSLAGEAAELVGQPHYLFRLCAFGGVSCACLLDCAPRTVGTRLWAVRPVRWLHVGAVNLWVSWVVLEILVRVFVAASGHQWVAVSGPAALPPHRPMHEGYQTNVLGFYDDEFPMRPDPGTTHILALGDSFAFGVVPPPENYLTLLEREWSTRWGTAVEVLNCGVPGSGPEDYRSLFRLLQPRLPVDAVLLTLFMGNDITEWHPDRPFPALKHTYAVMAARRFGPVLAARGRTAETSRFSEEEYRVVVARRLAVCRPAGDPVDAAYRRAREHVQALLTDCAERKIPVAIVLAPAEFQVNDAVRAIVAGDNLLRTLDLSRPQRELTAWGEARDVPVVDLTSAIRAADAVERAYVPRNTHWNARGNAVAAQTIAAQLPAFDRFRIPRATAAPD